MEMRMIRTWGDGTKVWEVGLCRICGQAISEAENDEAPGYPATVCKACAPLSEAHYRDGIQTVTPEDSRFEDECPRLFRSMLLDELEPHYVDSEAYRTVVDWRPDSGSGLIIVGDSGTGKTLALWGLKRELMKQDIRCDLYGAVELSRELSRHAKDLDVALHLWKTKVLMIDDMGKEPITPAASALFWELVDRRYQNMVPTIITTRFSGKAFEDRFREPALGHDIRRRIKDTCRPVQFKAKGKS
jgi:hypothetical protein